MNNCSLLWFTVFSNSNKIEHSAAQANPIHGLISVHTAALSYEATFRIVVKLQVMWHAALNWVRWEEQGSYALGLCRCQVLPHIQVLFHIDHVFQAHGASVDPFLLLVFLSMLKHKLLSVTQFKYNWIKKNKKKTSSWKYFKSDI